MRQFHIAAALMSVIPLLTCFYLITVRFFSISALLGINGGFFLMAVLIATLGLTVGRKLMARVVQELVQHAEASQKILHELERVNTQLREELTQRKQAEQALSQEQRYAQGLTHLRVQDREEQIQQLKKEINTLSEELGKPVKYREPKTGDR